MCWFAETVVFDDHSAALAPCELITNVASVKRPLRLEGATNVDFTTTDVALLEADAEDDHVVDA
jgi:hypothetical protein